MGYYKSQGFNTEALRRFCEGFSFGNGVHPIRQYWKVETLAAQPLLDLFLDYQHEVESADDGEEGKQQRAAATKKQSAVARAWLGVTWYALTGLELEPEMIQHFPPEVNRAYKIAKLEADKSLDTMSNRIEREAEKRRGYNTKSRQRDDEFEGARMEEKKSIYQ